MADDVHELRHGAKRQPRAGMEAPSAQLMHRKTVAVGSAPVRGAGDGETDAVTPQPLEKQSERATRLVGLTSRLV